MEADAQQDRLMGSSPRTPTDRVSARFRERAVDEEALKIGSVELSRQVMVVAEIGNNHEGDLRLAKRLVDEAAQTGVDAVKFQTFRTEHYIHRGDRRRFSQLKSFELPFSAFRELAERARSRGLAVISTPFDLESARVLEEIVDAFKVASSDNTFYPLIHQLGATNKPIVVSTGLSDVAQVQRTVAELEAARQDHSPQLVLLHCVSSYPAPPSHLNLRAIALLDQLFPHLAGFSDHSIGTDAAPLAVALGARLIEKHFTLKDIDSDFRDHALSLNSEQMVELVRRVRTAEVMLGRHAKEVAPSEAENATAMRRSIVASRDLRSGHVVTPADLTWVRPGGGLPPGEEERLLGRALRRAVPAGERFEIDDVTG